MVNKFNSFSVISKIHLILQETINPSKNLQLSGYVHLKKMKPTEILNTVNEDTKILW